MTNAQRPRYDELPMSEHGGRHAWDLPGFRSQGTLGDITSDLRRDAAKLVQLGEVVSLNAPLDVIDPPLFGRESLRREVEVKREGLVLDDRLDAFFPQVSSQWDALNHIGVAPGVFFGGADLAGVLNEDAYGVDIWARRGIAGRGVLIDVVPVLDEWRADYHPGKSVAFSVDQIEAARRAQGVELRLGDILIIHTGFLDWYRGQSRAQRKKLSAAGSEVTAIGIEHSENAARYLWNSGASALATDSLGLEVWPPDRSEAAQPFGFLHRALIGLLGFAIGELWDLTELLARCRALDRWEFLVASAPLSIQGGVGSPANAIALL